MPKGAHLKKEHDLKRVKSILLRFTQQEFIQLQNYCKGRGIERSEMVREAVFNAINFQDQEPTAAAKELEAPVAKTNSVETDEVARHLEAEKSVQEFLEELKGLFQENAQQRRFERKVDCNIYRANIYEFTNLLNDYSKKALKEEFVRYCEHLFSAPFFNSHLFRGFEIHISDNFLFWNKHNRGSSNYIGY